MADLKRLQQLLRKVQRAEAGSDELDRLVDRHFPTGMVRLATAKEFAFEGAPMTLPMGWTQSVDAALSLVQCQFPGWMYWIGNKGEGGRKFCAMTNPDDAPTKPLFGSTLPLAIIAAALCAKIKELRHG